MNRKIKLKILVIGNPRSGKSAFIHNLAVGQFLDFYTATEGYTLTPFTMINNGITYEIMLWDCGAEHLQYNKHIRNACFRNASAAIVIFDICDKFRDDNMVELGIRLEDRNIGEPSVWKYEAKEVLIKEREKKEEEKRKKE